MLHDPSTPHPTVRIGAVTYLNAQPLVYGLDRFAPGAEVVVDVPSRLADGLSRGTLDVAIIPSIELLRHPERRIVSDACIACDGPVRSVKLLSRVPIEQIRSLALDEGSRTSVALAQILLQQRYGLTPKLYPLPIGMTVEETTVDAVVLIGDRAMLTPDDGFACVWDLGHEWRQATGLPFVFALWVARPGVELSGIEQALCEARAEGMRHLDEIAQRAALSLGLPEAFCLAYLRDHLRFHLGPREREGLELYFDLAVRYGLAAC